jgi:hypothetical protein
VLVGLRKGTLPHQVIAFGEKGTAYQEDENDYAPLAREVIKFFRTGISPINQEETIEIFAFMESQMKANDRGVNQFGWMKLLLMQKNKLLKGNR